jgi:hypothetical protein
MLQAIRYQTKVRITIGLAGKGQPAGPGVGLPDGG